MFINTKSAYYTIGYVRGMRSITTPSYTVVRPTTFSTFTIQDELEFDAGVAAGIKEATQS